MGCLVAMFALKDAERASSPTVTHVEQVSCIVVRTYTYTYIHGTVRLITVAEMMIDRNHLVSGALTLQYINL